jgi:hypothetical protein
VLAGDDAGRGDVVIGALLLFLHEGLGHEKAAAFLGVDEAPDPRTWCWLCRNEDPPPGVPVRRRTR